MHLTTKKLLIGLLLAALFSCRQQPKPRIDLARLNLNEKVRTLINYDDRVVAGVNTVETLPDIVIEVGKTNHSYSFNGMPLDSAEVIFQLNSEAFRKDTSLHDGIGHYNIERVKSDTALTRIINHYQADSTIHGYRISLKDDAVKARVLKDLIKQYGPGTKNPTTDHGLYWNLKDKQRLVLFAPDYDRLIMLNTTNLSKTCYQDNMNGIIDLGGCNIDQYFDELYFRKKQTKLPNSK